MRRAALVERAGALTPRDRIWSAIRMLDRCRRAGGAAGSHLFTPAEVIALTRLHVDTVCTYFRALAAAAPPFIRLFDRRPARLPRRECFRYELVRDVGVEAPSLTADGMPTKPRGGAEQMWAAMKALREFDSRELATVASQGAARVSEQTAKTYLKFLARAGYLSLAAPSKPGVQARYRFIRSMNSGPRAPLVCRDKSVMDGNTGRIVWTPVK